MILEENLFVACRNDGVSNRPFFFFLFTSLNLFSLKFIFSCEVRISRAIGITSFWPKKEQAQSQGEAASNTSRKFIVSSRGWIESGMMKNPKPEENMLHCGDDESVEIHIFPSRSTCCYLPILFSGVINWLINNKITCSHTRNANPLRGKHLHFPLNCRVYQYIYRQHSVG